jgi:hypothetical protein
MVMRIRGVTAVTCGVLLTLASCGSSKTVNTAAPAAAPAATTVKAATTGVTAAAPAVSTAAPAASTTLAAATPAAALPEIYNFKANKVGGGAVDGAEFAGKPVAFWFWAPT